MTTRVDKIIKAYAEDLKGLTMEECVDADFSEAQCEVLTYVLDTGYEGEITPDEQTKLEQSGFAKDFIKGIAGNDGNKALQARVRWLGDQIVPIMRSGICSANCDVERRFKIILEIGLIGPAAKEDVTSLIQALQDEEVSVRRIVISTLGEVGPAASPAVFELIQALKDKEENVRLEAASSLGKIGSTAAPAIPVLEKMTVDDPSSYCRQIAKYALEKLMENIR